MMKENIKTSNSNGLCYKELDGFCLGDVFSYISERGILRHYVISFLHMRMKHPVATIIFPDGFSETISTYELKANKDKYTKRLKNWALIYEEYKDEAQMYL